MTYKFETYVNLDEENEVNVEVTYDATYQRARVSGPPEDCYPAEGELTITTVTPLDPRDVPPLYKSQFENEVENAMERLEEEAWENYHSRQEDGGYDE